MNETWRDEAVEYLEKAWRERKSATQIAGELYAVFRFAVTRNAVIGKVHRLGLSGSSRKVQPSAAKLPRRRVQHLKTPSPEPPPAKPSIRAPTALHAPIVGFRDQAMIAGHAARQAKRASRAGDRPACGPPAPSAAGLAARASAPAAVADLRIDHCRFPIGDPLAADFRFCAAVKSVDESYCPHHAWGAAHAASS